MGNGGRLPNEGSGDSGVGDGGNGTGNGGYGSECVNVIDDG